MELLEDGYRGDVLGESTPDALVSEFVCSLTLLFLFWFNFSFSAYV